MARGQAAFWTLGLFSHLLKVWLSTRHTQTQSLSGLQGAEKEEELGEMLPHALWLIAPPTGTTPHPTPTPPQAAHTDHSFPAYKLTVPAHAPCPQRLLFPRDLGFGVTMPRASLSQMFYALRHYFGTKITLKCFKIKYQEKIFQNVLTVLLSLGGKITRLFSSFFCIVISKSSRISICY